MIPQQSLDTSSLSNISSSILDLKDPVPCPLIYKNKIELHPNKPLPPAMINHIFYNRKYMNYNKNYFVYFSTQRVRMKIINIIYCKPTNSTF